jgi:membrane protein
MSKDIGSHAEKPLHIPLAGWKQVLLRVKDQMDKNKLPIMAAGVAFYFFMAIFPALLAVVSLYALATDPLLVREHLEKLEEFMPPETHEFISEKIENIVDAKASSKSWGLALSFIFSLWSANKGTFTLFRAINETYDEKSKRGMIKQNAITLGFTLCLLLVVILSLFIVVAYPIVQDFLELPEPADTLLAWSRWLVLAVIFMFSIALIYQFAPQRSHPKFRWISTGAIIATLLWIIGSLILTIYVQNFDQLEDLYGQISALIILMIWLNITSFAMLLGAQINAELEHQTEYDTTQGEEKPMGERNARFADHVAGEEKGDDKEEGRK